MKEFKNHSSNFLVEIVVSLALFHRHHLDHNTLTMSDHDEYVVMTQSLTIIVGVFRTFNPLFHDTLYIEVDGGLIHTFKIVIFFFSSIINTVLVFGAKNKPNNSVAVVVVLCLQKPTVSGSLKTKKHQTNEVQRFIHDYQCLIRTT